MPVLQLWRIEIYVDNLHIYLIILTMASQIYKNWDLYDSNSIRTGACITKYHTDQFNPEETANWNHKQFMS